ncbi:MAG: hypothetical protein IJX58_07385 [Clostridia bacterium]|nr:hypothetical protein [Clostridia bacterium]
MYINVVTVICLAFLIIETLYLAGNIIFKKRKQQIAFVRSFKKGKFAVIYLTAIPLYLIGHLYTGTAPANAFFLAIHKIINLVVLKYDVSSIEALMLANELYKNTVYFCFILVGVNAILFTLSLTIQHIWCGIQGIMSVITSKPKLYLFGNNDQNVAIYLSDKGKRNKTIIDDISDEDCEKLYMEKVSFVSTPSPDLHLKGLLQFAKRINREHTFIINTGDEEKNIMLCTAIIDELSEASDEVKKRLFLKLKVYVFGDPRYQAIYEDIISSGFGCIHYVNKYQKMAVDFIDRYPLALFMNEKQMDYEKSLVRDGVDINVALIGFGQTNQQVFLTSVANNQFLTAGEGDPVLKPVKYSIFDKDPAENNKNLNHSYYRFKHECHESKSIVIDDYLPMPTLPAEEEYFLLDINNKDFYNKIRNIVMRNPDDANFIVIAFGTDLENLDMAQKLVEKRKEWNLDNLIIFVKVRVWHKEQTLLEEKGCYFIGNENDSVYDIEKIVGDKLFKMAKMRNETYDLEYNITHNAGLVIDKAYLSNQSNSANENWYKEKSQMERDSSLFGCLSLRSKLNMMNLDYCPVDQENSPPGLTEEEYIDIYAPDDRPVSAGYSFRANEKEILQYDLDFKNSRRRNMAIQEHQRWNSFMISRGIIPSTKDQILNEMVYDNKKKKYKHSNGKNYAVRRHGNLTTFDGLVEFRQMIANRDKASELEADVIKYDYQILDDAYWLLSKNDFKIIHKRDHV